MNEKELIKFIKGECKKYNINFILKNTKTVKFTDGFRCSGYFDEKNLVVAKNRPDYIQILVHEYGHLTQYVEQCPLWGECSKTNSHDKLDRWLAGEEVKDIEHALSLCRDLELDNEKRSIKIIKKFNLNINIDIYIKRANAYVHFYNYLLYSRRWSRPSNSPYNNKRLLNAMSTKFDMNYKKLSKKMFKLFEEENI
jgi:hypothetical protein